MELIKQGGRRLGAGRKPMDKKEKKVVVNLFIQQKFVDKYKGIDRLKKIIIDKVISGTL